MKGFEFPPEFPVSSDFVEEYLQIISQRRTKGESTLGQFSISFRSGFAVLTCISGPVSPLCAEDGICFGKWGHGSNKSNQWRGGKASARKNAASWHPLRGSWRVRELADDDGRCRCHLPSPKSETNSGKRQGIAPEMRRPFNLRRRALQSTNDPSYAVIVRVGLDPHSP